MERWKFVTAWLTVTMGQCTAKLRERDDRGDVPGWVMVTVMSSILVVAILAVFEPQIKDAVTSAIGSVTNSK